MKGARKLDPPQEFMDWIALENENWKPDYPIDDRCVLDAVIGCLNKEQRGLCVYCGRRLDMSSPGKSFHIEHFRPQHGPNGRPELKIHYNNLYLSCGQEGPTGGRSQTCGTRKSDWFNESDHIEPDYPECTSRFRFLLSGRIEPKIVSDQPASTMIEMLGLDHPELVKDREELLALLDSEEVDADDFWDSDSMQAQSYGHVAFSHVGDVLP